MLLARSVLVALLTFYPIAARHTTFAAGPRVADWSPGDYGVAWHLETVKARR